MLTKDSENCRRTNERRYKVHMIKLTEKDPNDIGYEKFTDIKIQLMKLRLEN